MWCRADFKDRAKVIMRDHYWKVFFICLLAALLSATSSSANSGSEVEYNTNSGVNFRLDLGLFEYNIPLEHYYVAAGLLITALFSAAVIAGILLNTFVLSIIRVGFCRFLIKTQQNGYPADASELF